MAEEKILFALVCRKEEPDLARHTARLTPRLLELAGDENAYDPDNAVEPGRFAAELIAITGVPREYLPALEALLERDGILLHVRRQAILALVKTDPQAAEAILVAARNRAKAGKSRLPASDIEEGRRSARDAIERQRKRRLWWWPWH